MAENSRPNLYLVSNDNPTGGGRPPGDGELEARVRALEDKFQKVDSKLDTIIGDVGGLRTDVAYMKGKLESAPSAQAFGELKGRVDSLPTTAKAATLLGIAVAVMTIVIKWSAIAAIFTPHP